MRFLVLMACMTLPAASNATDGTDETDTHTDTDTDSDIDSDAVSPVTGQGAGEFAGENGGMDCSASGTAAFALPLFLLVAAGTRRRR